MEEQLEAVQRMQDYIAAHLEETITLANLASASRYSPWYAARLLDDDFRTPAQVAEETRSVTVEQLQECAGRLSLDTVYRLVAEKEEVQAQ